MKKDKLPLVTAVSSFDAVVLCDGDYPSHAVALSILQHAKYLVCCDGAGMHYILHGGTPDAIVGDGDSLPDDFKRRYADLVHLVDEQMVDGQLWQGEVVWRVALRRLQPGVGQVLALCQRQLHVPDRPRLHHAR